VGELRAWRRDSEWPWPDDPVFPTLRGTPLSSDNVRKRYLAPAAEEADVAWAGFHTCRGLITRRSQVRILPPLCHDSPASAGLLSFLGRVDELGGAGAGPTCAPATDRIRAAYRNGRLAVLPTAEVIPKLGSTASEEETAMETIDKRVRDDVRAQLTSDARLPYPDEFAVGYDGYAVTLEGTIGSFAQQRAADGRRTPLDRVATLRGVTGVTNTIKVIEGRRP
jgi:hypothetical protein